MTDTVKYGTSSRIAFPFRNGRYLRPGLQPYMYR